jgi:hypothetical protein
MKTLSKIVLALGAVASFGATADTYYSGQADAARRERNREEALADYRAGHTTARADAHEAAGAVRHGTHEVAQETRHVTHEGANAVRHAGHKTAQAARNFTDRMNDKFGAPTNHGKANPEGVNPVGVSSASPTAGSNGVTK